MPQALPKLATCLHDRDRMRFMGEVRNGHQEGGGCLAAAVDDPAPVTAPSGCRWR